MAAALSKHTDQRVPRVLTAASKPLQSGSSYKAVFVLAFVVASLSGDLISAFL